MELQVGRPTDSTGRLEKELLVYDTLDQLGIPYERIDHEPANTVACCAEIDAVLQAKICKNLFLRTRTGDKLYLLMLPGNKKFKTKDISAQIGSSRLSFGEPELLLERLNLTPGSVSIFGLLFDPEHRVQLLMDEDLQSSEFIGCHPCINTSSLRLRTADLLEKFLPFVKHSPIFVHCD